MTKNLLVKTLSVLSLTLALSACRYSNEFSGTFNGEAAKLTALSNNTDKYCIALSLVTPETTRKNFISAQSVFDENSLTEPKSFNTKGTPCNANMSEYLAGTRTSQILGKNVVMDTQIVSFNLCRTVYYTQYLYQDALQFEIRSNADDQLVGTFTGKGLQDSYTDYAHPSNYSAPYICGNTHPGFPHPPHHFGAFGN